MLDTAEFKKKFPLTGEQTRISLFEKEDVTQEYVNWLNDPEVVRFSNQRFHKHSIESCNAYYQSFVGTNNLFLSIRLRDSSKMIGTMSVYRNLLHNTADIGILIGDKSVWGKGVGKDAWSTVMDFLLYGVGVRKVTGGTLSCNIGMINIMRRLGMVDDGTRNRQEIVDAEEYDIVYFAKFARTGL